MWSVWKICFITASLKVMETVCVHHSVRLSWYQHFKLWHNLNYFYTMTTKHPHSKSVELKQTILVSREVLVLKKKKVVHLCVFLNIFYDAYFTVEMDECVCVCVWLRSWATASLLKAACVPTFSQSWSPRWPSSTLVSFKLSLPFPCSLRWPPRGARATSPWTSRRSAPHGSRSCLAWRAQTSSSWPAAEASFQPVSRKSVGCSSLSQDGGQQFIIVIPS